IHWCMKRRLSSLQTPFMKFLFPGFIGAWMICSGVWPDGPFPPPNGPLLVVLIASSITSWRTFMQLKEVSVDQDFLYISNFLKEISLPLSEIKHVTESRWNTRAVTIHLYSPSEFGDKIVFMPTTGFFGLFGLFSSHPVVAELKQLASSNRVAGPSLRSPYS